MPEMLPAVIGVGERYLELYGLHDAAVVHIDSVLQTP